MNMWLEVFSSMPSPQMLNKCLWQQLRKKETKLTIASKILQRSSASFVQFKVNHLKTTPWYIRLWSVPLSSSSRGYSNSSRLKNAFSSSSPRIQQAEHRLCPSLSKVEKLLVSGGVCHQMIPAAPLRPFQTTHREVWFLLQTSFLLD